MTRKALLLAIAVAAAAGCAEQWSRRDGTRDRIGARWTRRWRNAPSRRRPRAVSQALLPPLVVEMPRAEGAPLDQRFDLNVNNAPASQVFMAIVSGTRYSMVVHPDVRDTISVNLKDVTVLEALETMRDLYGYEYRVQGNRITVLPINHADPRIQRQLHSGEPHRAQRRAGEFRLDHRRADGFDGHRRAGRRRRRPARSEASRSVSPKARASRPPRTAISGATS